MDCSVYKAVRFMENQRKIFIFNCKFDSFIYTITINLLYNVLRKINLDIFKYFIHFIKIIKKQNFHIIHVIIFCNLFIIFITLYNYIFS